MHYRNGDRADNRRENLVLCANEQEHMRFHRRSWSTKTQEAMRRAHGIPPERVLHCRGYAVSTVLPSPDSQLDEVHRPASDRKFRPDVEGVRAVAVALVVLYHAGVGPFPGGYVGVDVFFVLSGFLITGQLIAMREATAKAPAVLVDFYARRTRRILPAGTIVLVVTVLASYHWLGFLRADTVAEDGQWTAVFAANVHFALQGTQYLTALAPPSPLQHYWSLAVEEQFYLVWPLLILVASAVGAKIDLRSKLAAALLVLIAASFAWSVVQTQQNATWAYFSPLTRAWELAIGAILAVMTPSLLRIPARFGPWMSWTGLVGIIASAVFLSAATAFPGSAAALPVLSTALVIAGGTAKPGSGAEIVLGRAPFQWLGKLSYSLYLWHWPLLQIAAETAGKTLSPADNLRWVALALVLAFLTYQLAENPIRRSQILRRHPWYSLAFGAILVLVSYGFCSWQLHTN